VCLLSIAAAAADVSSENTSAINDSDISMMTSANDSLLSSSSSDDSYSVWTTRMREVLEQFV